VLDDYLDAGRPVVVVDYVWDEGSPLAAGNVARVDDFASRALDAGLVPYVAVVDRALDEVLTVAAPPFAVAQPRAALFADGFEAGNASAWSASVP
jgi:endo-alpha-1,4-polygalactosaminidase (GH114 family)